MSRSGRHREAVGEVSDHTIFPLGPYEARHTLAEARHRQSSRPHRASLLARADEVIE
jgi:hypothetical protein